MLTFNERVEWMADNLKIIDKHARKAPLVLNEVQLILEAYKCQCAAEEQMCRILVLKARREGVSTWAEATLFLDAFENDNQSILICAHKQKATEYLLSMSTRYHANLPEDIRPKLRAASAGKIHFDANDSFLLVETAGSGASAGRAFGFNRAHFSELDSWPNASGTYGAIMQTIPDLPQTVVIIESTANGPMLIMDELWTQASAGRSEYRPFFFAWHEFHEYVRSISWRDLRKYAPRQWLMMHKNSLRHWEKHDDTLGSRFIESGGVDPGRTSGGTRTAHAEEEGQKAPRITVSGTFGLPGVRSQPGVRTRTLGARLPPGFDFDPGGGTREAGNHEDRGGDDDAQCESGPLDGEGSAVHQVRGSGQPPAGIGLSGQPTQEGSDRTPTELDGLREIARPNTERSGLLNLEQAYVSSLTDYERDLAKEFPHITLDHVNWLRYTLESKCKGDETSRRREYPSRPDEAFEATQAYVLDPMMLSSWRKFAEENPGHRVTMLIKEIQEDYYVVGYDYDERGGMIELYPWPDEDGKLRFVDPQDQYCMAIDCAQGIPGQEHDATVGIVVSVKEGYQVAEFRAQIPADDAVDQLERLAIFFNRAIVAIEITGGFGIPYIRHFTDRKTVQLYERQQFDKGTKRYLKVPGWSTDSKTRPGMVSETQYATRHDSCQLRSIATIDECRTLWRNPKTGKVEARPECHDDGWAAWGIALNMRNELAKRTREKRNAELEENSILARLNRLDKEQRIQARFENIRVPKIQARFVHGKAGRRVDGRRSVF